MPKYLLKINKRKWDKIDVPWLQAQDIQADPLSDLRISEGTLSVWHVEDDMSNLDLIITAIAATRQNFDKFEYGLFDPGILDTIDVKIEQTIGNTPINIVNSWHRDLIQLTVDKVSSLIKGIFSTLNKNRLFEDDVEAKVVNAARAGHIDIPKVNKSMRDKIKQLI